MSVAPQDPFFDRTMIEITLQLASQQGWQRVSLVEASREAGFPLQEVRQRFPFKAVVLLRLNRQIDEAALCGESYGNTLRERLFDLLMRRFDAMQDYRAGICAVMKALPRDPALAAFLAGSTMESLRWIADTAGLARHGLGGVVRLNALLAIWSKTLISWKKDNNPDLADTMNTLDHALDRAERMGLLRQSTSSQGSGPLPGGSPSSRTSSDVQEEASGLPDHIATDEPTSWDN